MEFETEFDYISPYSGSDYVSAEIPIEEPIDESLIIQAGYGEEDDTSSPDAIEIDNNDNVSEVLYSDISSWESLDNNNDQVSDQEPVQNETLQDNPELLDGETLSNIYKLLNERIPEQKTRESESESESESDSELESEVSLKEIKTILENIENYESEQLSAISTVNDNIINSINNDYHFYMYEIGLLSALIGSFAISALFRKIL